MLTTLLWIEYEFHFNEAKVQTCHCTVAHQKGVELIVSLQTW